MPPPYYIRPSQAGLQAFFKTVADASSVPLILYDIPYRTGVSFEQATLLDIVAHENIVAIKDCGGNLNNTLALLASGKVDVLCGEDNRASGAIAASAHIHPELFVQLHRQILDQQLVAARSTFFQLTPLIQSLFAEPNPAPVKSALALQGLIRDELRAPMLTSSGALLERLQTTLASLKQAVR